MNTWKPILSKESELYQETFLKLNELANFIFEKANYHDQNTGLFSGKGGVSLFFAYYYKFTKNEIYLEKTISICKEILKDISLGNFQATFAFGKGIPGIIWLFKHLDDLEILEVEIEDYFEGIFDVTYETIQKQIEDDNFNLFSGAMGLINILISNVHYPKNLQKLSSVISLISKKLTYCKKGAYFYTVLDLNNNSKGIAFSIAYGLSGLLSILCKCIKMNIEIELCSKMCDSISKFILSNFSIQTSSFFPVVLRDGLPTEYIEKGWLAGDLGTLYALIGYAEVKKDEKLKTWCYKLIDDYSIKENVSFEDVNNLTTGNISNNFMYQLLFNQHPSANLRTIAELWLVKTLEKIEEDGFIEYDLRRSGWSQSYRTGLMFGLDGVGLALIASISDISPNWKESINL